MTEKAPLTTCQICGRAIKTVVSVRKSGIVIAHHGYRRPHLGHQTGSCPGARELPYEVSRDRIPSVIQNDVEDAQRSLDLVDRNLANPPATLTEYRWSQRRGPVEHPRPEGFDTSRPPASYRLGYESQFWHMIQWNRDNAAACHAEIDFLADRWRKWVAPAPAPKE